MENKQINTTSHMARTIQALEANPNATIVDLASAVHGSNSLKNVIKVRASLNAWRKKGISIGPSKPGARVMCLGFGLTEYSEEECNQYHTSYMKRIRSQKNSIRIHDTKVIERHPQLYEALLKNAFQSFEDEKQYYADITEKHKRLEGGPETA